jgi:hypothetical protein
MIGAIVAIVNVVLTYTELMPFFQAIKQLNEYTSRRGNIYNRMVYPFRFVSLLPKAAPLVLDAAIAMICGTVGLSGGVYGALIGLTLGFTASMLVKFHRHFIAPKMKVQSDNWR